MSIASPVIMPEIMAFPLIAEILFSCLAELDPIQ